MSQRAAAAADRENADTEDNPHRPCRGLGNGQSGGYDCGTKISRFVFEELDLNCDCSSIVKVGVMNLCDRVKLIGE
jgi:hypothetical protein